MDLYGIIQQLIAERDRLSALIAALEALSLRKPKPAPKRRGRISMSQEDRREVSVRMRAYWARRRQEAAAKKAAAESSGQQQQQKESAEPEAPQPKPLTMAAGASVPPQDLWFTA